MNISNIHDRYDRLSLYKYRRYCRSMSQSRSDYQRVMRGLAALTGLFLVVNFVENVSGQPLYEKVGTTRRIADTYYGSGNLIQCSVEHNNIHYGIYPESNLTNIENSSDNRQCIFVLPVNFDNAGSWKINTVWKLNSNPNVTKQDSYELHVQEITEALPATEIHGEKGSYATVYFKTYFNNITNCYVVNKAYGSSHAHAVYKLGNNGNGTSVGLEIYGPCGVRMPVNNNFAGNWELFQESGAYKVKRTTFQIKPHEKATSSQQLHLTWRRGSSNAISDNRNIGGKLYCELERPDGQIVHLTPPKCTYLVEEVSNAHAGIWKMRYASETSMNAVEQEIVVKVLDPQAVNVTVIESEDDRIHMLCQTSVDVIEYCLFTTPNGTVINVLPGNENEKYKYFGNGFHAISETELAQCGLTILRPSSDDYGLWKCSMKELTNYPKTSEILNAFVSTAYLAGKPNGNAYIPKRQIYVKRGDNFTIKCTTSTSLDYCWLQSPNGTSYSVTKSHGNSQNSLPYVGEGLSIGDCGATIVNASDTHTGDWGCRLGITRGAEIESIVSVTVTDSYITPVHKAINIARDIPKLIVNILPDKEATIEYCRWVRPNGHGFYEENNDQYLRSQSDTSCILTLTDWKPEDLGTWSCYARLSTGSDEEVHTTIRLFRETPTGENMTLSITLICIAALTVVSGVIYAFFFFKRRVQLSKLPSTYYNEFDPSKHQGPIIMKESLHI